MFIPDFSGFIFSFVIFFVHFLENIFEESVVFLQNSIFSGQVQWVFSIQSVVEACSGEISNRFFGVVHSNTATTTIWVVVDFKFLLWSSISWGINNFKFSWSIDNEISSSVLISMSVSANDDGIFPLRNQSWDVFTDNWGSKDSTA